MSNPGYLNNCSTEKTEKTTYREWIYGILFPYPAKILMKAIYEVLTQMNTVYNFSYK